MISNVNSSNPIYIPMSRPAAEVTAPEESKLNSQPSQAISYPNSITQKTPSAKTSDEEGAERENLRAEDRAAKAEAEQQDKVQQVVAQLEARDKEVRVHEMAHLAAAGSYAIGGMNLTFQRGPDGQQYAIGGSVQIDTSPVSGDHEATIQKGRIVQQAALAPAEPSAQDRKVASAASQMISDAQSALTKEKQEERINEEEEKAADLDASRVDSASKEPTYIKPEVKHVVGGIASGLEAQVMQSGRNVVTDARAQFDLRMQVAS